MKHDNDNQPTPPIANPAPDTPASRWFQDTLNAQRRKYLAGSLPALTEAPESKHDQVARRMLAEMEEYQ